MIFDLVFITIIFLLVVVSTIKGFINMLFGLGAPVVSFWIAAVFYGSLAQAFAVYITSQMTCIIISYILIFMVSFLILKIVQHIVRSIFDNEILGSLNRVLGFVFGVFAGLAFVIAVIVVLLAVPDEGLNATLRQSAAYNFLSRIITFPQVNIFGK